MKIVKFKFCFFANLIVLTTTILNPTQITGQSVFPPRAKPLEVPVIFTNISPEIDGKLTESIWQKATPIGNFIQVEPHQGEPSEYETQVRLVYTTENLYIGVFCADPNGSKFLRAPHLHRDFPWLENDTFAIAIDGFNDKRNSITVATNPYGAQKDYLSFDDTLFDEAWNGLWKVRTTRTDSGWVAEFEIPFKSLRYPDQPDSTQQWGINFVRLQRKSNEISVWSLYPRSFGFNRMEYAGITTKFEVPKPSSNVQINPYLLMNSEDADLRNTSEITIKPGGEMKWAVTPNSVIDLTLNTDFAQAEADVQVSNVNRYHVLFPEKRSFFLENASLFGVGLTQRGDGTGGNMRILPFFSRRIGLDSTGDPKPITGGFRAVHRSVNNNAGILYMHQQSSDALPSTHVAVGRYSKNIGKRNRVGTLMTFHHSTGINSYSNWLGSIDGFFRLGNSQTVNTMIMQTQNTNQHPTGYAGYFQYTYVTNTIKAWWTQSAISENFKPELGFVSRENIIATTPGVYTTIRENWIPLQQFIRSFQPAIEMAWYHQASSGRLTEREIIIYPFWLGLQSGGSIGYSTSSHYQFLDSMFEPLGVRIAPGDYNYIRHAFYLNSDPSKKISYTLKHEFGNYFNGTLSSGEYSIQTAPIPHTNLQVSFTRNKFQKVGAEEINRSVNLFTLQSFLALNPRIQFTSIYQWNTYSQTDALNFRFVWEYSPLSYIYLVYNSREFLDNENVLQQQTSSIFKITYLKQF